MLDRWRRSRGDVHALRTPYMYIVSKDQARQSTNDSGHAY